MPRFMCPGYRIAGWVLPAVITSRIQNLKSRRSIMKSLEDPRRAFVKNGSSHRPVRTLLAAFAGCAAIALAPHFLPVTAAVAPTFTQTNLVSDLPGMAKITDPNLVNPWGMALGINSGIWISQNGSGMATSYDGTGKALAPAITIPAPDGSTGAPTGVATNATTG